MKRTLITLLLAASIVSCHAQQEKKKTEVSSNQPVTSWKVNKQYDNKGNLVRYDSTYSYSYSSSGNSAEADSLMQQFRQQWNTQFNFGGLFRHPFPMFTDSLFSDIALPGHFSQQWSKQDKAATEAKRNML